MLWLKLLQSLVRTLNSQGTPLQVGAGLALGACLGLTPLASLHNLAVLLLAMLLTVSLPAVVLGWTLFVPVGFVLDPLFDRVGRALLEHPGLRATWVRWYNTPGVPLTDFTNSVVLGSFACWLGSLPLLLPLLTLAVDRYRRHVLPRLVNTPLFAAVRSSRLYNVYQWFHAG